MGFLFLWLILAGGVAIIADSRGRSAFGFFVLSFLLSPLVGLIAVFVVKDLKAAPQVESPAGSVADELEKLAKLRTDGVLSDEEFDAQKAAVLGSGPRR